MGEAELVEIEERADQYPQQARDDVLLLTRELRRLYRAGARSKAEESASPLYDALTGLPNAGAYGVRFAMARARATRYRKLFAVMAVDLDFSKAPPSGLAERERAIRAVAERLGTCVRATDTLARIGDESFVIILEDLAQPGDAERVKQIVQEALLEPICPGLKDVEPAIRVQLQFYPAQRTDGTVH